MQSLPRKNEGNDFTLIKILSETPTNVSQPAVKEYPKIPASIRNRDLDGEIKNKNSTAIEATDVSAEYATEENNIPKKNFQPAFKSESLDNTDWHLRYLYITDGVEPKNITEDEHARYFSVMFDKFLNKVKGITPCTSFEAKLLTNDTDKFDCYNVLEANTRCNIADLQQTFFNQLQTVNRYDIVENKLRLFKDSKMLLLFEGFAVK